MKLIIFLSLIHILIEGKKAIVLLNKTDLDSVLDVEALKNRVKQKILPISAREKTGIDQLEETIKEMFFQGEISFNDEVYITNIRQKTALQEALKSFYMVEESIEAGMPEDFYSIDLMNAYEELSLIHISRAFSMRLVGAIV